MFCSAIIPTICRPTLTRSVASVLNQEFNQDDFEVIVVNDTGKPLPEMEWQQSPHVRVITTQKRERSVARNTGAAIAKGEYLYFLDDDDIMLPGALQEFWELSQKTDAGWLFGSYRTVDNDGRLVAEFHPDIAGNISAWLVVGEGIPLQVSFFQAKAFYGAGEFDVYFTGAQDRDLGRRLSLRYKVANTQRLVAQIRVGQEKSSTDWSKLRGFDRWGREKALEEPNAFQSIWDSARGNSNLHGRVESGLFSLSGVEFISETCLQGCQPLIVLRNFWHGVCFIPNLLGWDLHIDSWSGKYRSKIAL